MYKIAFVAAVFGLCAEPVEALPAASTTQVSNEPGGEQSALISSVRIVGVSEHPGTGISESSIQRVASDALASRIASASGAPRLTFDQMSQIADAITAAYRQAGFLTATAIIPPQRIGEDHVLTIEVVEGRVGEVRVVANGRLREAALRAPYRDLIGRPLQSETLGQAIRYGRDLPAAKVSTVLERGAKAGETDIVVTAEDEGRPYALRFGVNNHGTETSGRYRLEAGASLYSPLGLGDVLSASYGYALDPSDSWTGSASYRLPLVMTPGLSAVASISRSQLDLSTGPFAALDISGPTTQGAFGFEWKFANTPLFQAQATGTYIYETSKLDGLGLRLSDHAFDVVEAGLAFRQDQPSSRGVNFGQVTLRKSFNDRSASQNFIYGEHDSDFLIARLSLSRIQGLTADQRILVQGSGQYTEAALPPLEQFAIGGPESVRAAPLSAALSDRGLQLTAEYQVDAPGFGGVASPFKGRPWSEIVTFKAFYDWGRVSPTADNRRRGARPERYDGVGVGVDVNLPYRRGLQLTLTASTPLTDNPSAQTGDVQIWAALGFSF